MAGAILTSCITALLGLTVWLLHTADKQPDGDMSATKRWVNCPVCRQHIRQSPDRAIMLPHADTDGRLCPMSGEPIAGATR